MVENNMGKMTPPIGITGYTKPVTRKLMRQLVEENRFHFITGYSPIIYKPELGTYVCHMDERYDNKTVEELWELLRGSKGGRKLCYQD
ncbi:hypothetical protein P4493_04550 [Bacillus thuringiensis]|jgi:hypothetical protein|uniref:Uncharacterized protein n=3 Tax=Bacillus thuringiensis TaxID=1428 RepID=A0A9W3P712_BACTU|nr:hypothetical protein [Bacillus thuringiensis]AFQ30055.1 hypothetical protein BTF1_29772 [Bacillus thuringiensis HD-789]MED1153738.1 hypothetical protein [Bacillus paranthracis]MCR6819797.1 hypothetical protein [Bacillus thuringiensis]MED2087037.1 hypothetical protein [Bacillus thuringiensis]MED3194085.1 hypothetical protein [Bacillus thuringiensis]